MCCCSYGVCVELSASCQGQIPTTLVESVNPLKERIIYDYEDGYCD